MTEKRWEGYLYVFLCSIGIFEIGHLMGAFGRLSVSDCGKMILIIYAACVIFAFFGMIYKRKIMKGRKCVSAKEMVTSAVGIPGVVFLLLLGIQIYSICSSPVMQTAGDITLETVNSFLVTDEIYSVSPLTGKAFSGVPMRYGILCIPTLYTLLCKWWGLAPELLVGRIIPIVVSCTTYVSYYLLSGTLFGRDEKNKEKRLWFLVFVAMVFLLCEKMAYMEGYGILHGGHLGTTIRNSVLVPAVIYAGLEKKWQMMILCILAEACTVWTFWGFGVCAAVAVGLIIVKKLFSALASKEENS